MILTNFNQNESTQTDTKSEWSSVWGQKATEEKKDLIPATAIIFGEVGEGHCYMSSHCPLTNSQTQSL